MEVFDPFEVLSGVATKDYYIVADSRYWPKRPSMIHVIITDIDVGRTL